MKKMLATTLFMLMMAAFAAAQQPGSPQSPNPAMPGAGQQTMPGGAGQDQGPGAAQPGAQAPMSNAPVTEGCLGGSDPNYTVTGITGTTYKLNIPANANTSKLAAHVGESVQVQGNVNESGKAGNSIDVQGIGRGNTKCPGSGSTGAQSPQH
jgi:hypothetical protein